MSDSNLCIALTQNKGKESENSYQEITVGQPQKSTLKLNWNILMDTAVFLNQKRANVCEHMAKMMPSLSCVHLHSLSSDW